MALKKLTLFSTLLWASYTCAEPSPPNEDMGVLLDIPMDKVMGLSMNTSVNKKEQSVKDSAAAVFVISHEDIRRSGATNIPTALRMVPGLQVAQIDQNKWAISSRGFNGRFSTNLLVLMDGRAIYTPAFSGVYWHREDTLIEDIERIEVIRGAGAAMWGANAVNGVINIITKSAKQTHNGIITAGGGNQEQGFGSIRYGGELGNDFHYRVYAKGFNRNHNTTLANQSAQDDMENFQGGFKTYWQLNERDSITTQGDIYQARAGDKETYALTQWPFTLRNQDSPVNSNGGNIQTRWTHTFSETSETALKIYYQHDDSRWQFVNPLNMHEKTLDLDFQHRFSSIESHDLIWGLGYRYFDFATNKNLKLSFSPTDRHLQLFSAFLQDEISLLPEQLKLIIGSRLEHNDFTGIEIQPNARLLWTPAEQHSIWGAVSRAVRTPNITNQYLDRLTNTVSEPTPLPALVAVHGNANFKSESVLEYELGYRFQPSARLSFDIAGFYNQYHDLQAVQLLSASVITNSGQPYIEIPAQFTNKMRGESLGAELTVQWQPTEWLKLQPSYWFLKSSLHVPSEFQFTDGIRAEKDSPQQQFHFKASLNLPNNIELDTMLRYVDAVGYYQIPDYTALDIRLGWWALKNIEFSVVGQNLLDNRHRESCNTVSELPKTDIVRSVFGKVSVSF